MKVRFYSFTNTLKNSCSKIRKAQVDAKKFVELVGAAEDGAAKLTVDKEVVFTAMKKDLQKVSGLWQQVQ